LRGDAGRNRIEERAAAIASFRASARSLTRGEPTAPKPRKRVKSGGDGKGYGKGGARFAARGLVQDYLELCRNPLKDLRRWAAEDKRFGRAPRGFQSVFALRATPDKSFIAKGDDHAHNQGAAVALAKTAGLRGQPLPGLRLRVDADGSRGRADGVFARPGAGSGGDDRLRSFRAERGGGGLVSRIGGEAGSYGAAADAINAEFAEKLDGLRRRLPRWQIPAAVRALKNGRAVALQALRDQKQGERFAAREITRRARTGFPPTARPS
jgi:hypothetical protein